MSDISDIMIIGGGAAGMMAAAAAAETGCSVLLLERNEKTGKKIYITGKGRCNVTNACETQDIFSHIPRNAAFLYSAVYTYDNFRVMDFFEKQGVPLKIERGNRVFPVSDHASDIIRGLNRAMQRGGVTVVLHSRVDGIKRKGGIFSAHTKDGGSYKAKRVILATGGLAYPSTGSTGDGYLFASGFGHHLEKRRPSLTAINTAEAYIPQLQGLSLKNVRARIFSGKKLLYENFGEMMFTHFGVSGPLMLTASSLVGDELKNGPLSLTIDLKPALDDAQLDSRILHDFKENLNKRFKNALNRLLPVKMIPVVIALSGISPEKRINEITKQERQQLLRTIKHFPATLTGLRDFQEAVITRGGVDTKEIDPSTMESRLVSGLYFAGEIIDADAVTGGFNLQIAWSTGYLAGKSAAESVQADSDTEGSREHEF